MFSSNYKGDVSIRKSKSKYFLEQQMIKKRSEIRKEIAIKCWLEEVNLKINNNL